MTPDKQPTAENQQDKPYVTEAQAVIAKAAEQHEETTENFLVVDEYVDKVLEAAARGEITGSHGTYSREVLLDQINGFFKPVDQGGEPNPYVLIPGKGGLRDSFRALMDNPATSRSFEQSLKQRVAEHMQKRAELLSPDKIQEMGEAELDAAEVEEPMAKAAQVASGMIEIPDFIRNPQVAKAPVEAAPAPQTAAEQAPPEQETELQMNERFLRESQAELRDLYAQHRRATPGSYEADTLVNQIGHAKEDVGKFAQKVSRLKGENKW